MLELRLLAEKEQEGGTVLLLAAYRGELDLVQWLLTTGKALITERDNFGNTALLCAASGGHLELVQWLLHSTWLQKGWALVTEKNNHGKTALLQAASCGHWALVRWLLHDGGAVIVERDSCGKSALNWAIWSGSLEVVALLFDQPGVDFIATQDNFGDIALFEAAEYGRFEIVYWLLMHSNIIFPKEVFDYARECVYKNYKHSLGLWLDFYIFVATKPLLPLSNCPSLAHILAYTGNDKALLLDKSIDLLFSLFEAPKNLTLGTVLYHLLPSFLLYQKNALGLAIYQLYEHQLNPFFNASQQEIIRQTQSIPYLQTISLVQAQDNKEAPIIKTVLELSKLAEKTQEGNTILLQAAYCGELGVVQWLLKTKEAVITEKDNKGRTALLKAASQGHLELVRWLLNSGRAAITERDNEGNTALLSAASGGQLQVVQWLLHTTWIHNSWAKITEKDNQGMTALLQAAACGHCELVRWLLRRGGAELTEKDHCGKTVLHWAIRGGSLRVVKLLLVQKEVDLIASKDVLGTLALLDAAEYGRLEIVQWLLTEAYFIFLKKDINDAQESANKNNQQSLRLWLDFYIFVVNKPALPLTECMPLANILAYTGNDKALLLDKSLDLLFSLFKDPRSTSLNQLIYYLFPSLLQYPRRRALGLTIYQLYEHDLKPILVNNQQQIIERVMGEIDAHNTDQSSKQIFITAPFSIPKVNNVQQSDFALNQELPIIISSAVKEKSKNKVTKEVISKAPKQPLTLRLRGNNSLFLAARKDMLDVVQWLKIERDNVFTNETIDLALQISRGSVKLWLNLYKYLVTNPSPPLTKCQPLTEIVAYRGKNKLVLVNKTLFLLVTLFDNPAKKELVLTLHELHKQELQELKLWLSGYKLESRARILSLINKADDSSEEPPTQSHLTQKTRIQKIEPRLPLNLAIEQQEIIPSVEGYYSGEDIDLLIKALLKQNHFFLSKNYCLSGQMRKDLQVLRTYVLPATSKEEGFGHLETLIESIIDFETLLNIKILECQVLIPYKVTGYAHWVTVLVHYLNYQFTVTVYDSMASAVTASKTVSEVRQCINSLTKIEVILLRQKLKKIQFTDVYCGGYTAHVIAEAAMNPPPTPSELSSLICIDEFLTTRNNDRIERAKDAKIVATEKPNGYRGYALKGNGQASPEKTAKSEQNEKEVHHRCIAEFTRSFNQLSQTNQNHLLEKLLNERNQLVKQLDATKDSHKAAIAILSFYRNYCREELKIADDENPFAIFFKSKMDFQSVEIIEDLTSLDRLIKEILLTLNADLPELSIQEMPLEKVDSAGQEIQGNDINTSDSRDLYYQRLSKAMAGSGKGVNEVWEFFKHLDALESAIFYRPLILEVQKFICLYENRRNNRYVALQGFQKEDKFYYFLTHSKSLKKVPTIKIKETCNHILQAKIESVNPQQDDYVLTDVMRWFLQTAFTQSTKPKHYSSPLLYAAAKGNLEVVQWLVRVGGASITEKDADGNTALLIAALERKLDVVKWMLLEIRNITNKNEISYSALLSTALKDNLVVVQYLLLAGAAVDEMDINDYKLALKAASQGNLEVMRWLLQGDIPAIIEKKYYGNTALLRAAKEGNLKMVKWLLLEGGAAITEKNKYGHTALLRATWWDNLEVVQWLLSIEGGFSIAEKTNQGDTALLIAASVASVDMVQWLLLKGGATINETDSQGSTALLLAAETGNLSVVQWLLLEKRAVITEKDMAGNTALLRAVMKGKFKVVKWLLQEGGSKVTEKNNKGNTALLMAALEGQIEILQWLLSIKDGSSISEKNSDGDTALLIATRAGNFELVQWLLRKGKATITDRASYGYTALLIAAMAGDLEMVQWLLQEGGALITEKDYAGHTALLFAAALGRFDLVQWILRDGRAKITQRSVKGWTILMAAALGGSLEMVQWLLSSEGGASIRKRDYEGKTTLMFAALGGSLDMVQWLIRERGVSIRKRDYDGNTVLLIAAREDKLDIVQWLLSEEGAKITQRDKNGNTALLLAAGNGSLGVVQWLLEEKRADITEKNDDGDTALLVAALKGKLDLMQWLLKEGRALITETNNRGSTVLLRAAWGGSLEVLRWVLIESDLIITQEAIDQALILARVRCMNSVRLWLDFYNYLSLEQSLPLTQCMPLNEILTYSGSDKALLLDQSLSLLFSFFESPQKKALSLTLYQLHQQELFPLLCENQLKIIEPVIAEMNRVHDCHYRSMQAPIIQTSNVPFVNNESQSALTIDPDITSNLSNEQQLSKLILKIITTDDLLEFAVKDVFGDWGSSPMISYSEKIKLPGNLTQKLREANKSLYENIMLNTTVLMYKLMHNCEPSLSITFINRLTIDLRGDIDPSVFTVELNHWREHPTPALDQQAGLFQTALINLLKSKHPDYQLLFDSSTQESKAHSNNIFIKAKESIEEKVLDLFIQRISSVLHSWIAGRNKNELTELSIEPVLTLRAFLFTKRREAFVKRHPCGFEDNKVPNYYKNVIEQFEFKRNTQGKVAFIVVAHFVHTLPYFLEALTSLGDVVALISKQSGTVKTVRKSIVDIYKDILVPQLDKNNLKIDSTEAEFFFKKLFEQEQWKNHQFIILDHGGYFAPRINDVLKNYSNKIIGVVEHTWNGEVRYQEQLESRSPFPFPVLSVAHSTLKGLESEAVADSIVDALSGKVFTGAGISQPIKTLNRILIIGYGHIGKSVAVALKARLGERAMEIIAICDLSDITRKEAKREFSKITKHKEKYLKEADLIITATSTQALTQKDFSKLKSGAFIACATSSDDQITEDALQGYTIEEGQTKKIQTLCPKYKHERSGKYFYLIANGDSVNFTIGSTPHPIIHIVLTSILVDAHQLIKNSSLSLWNLKQIELFNGEDDLIKKNYEAVFGRLSTEETGLTNRIQQQSIALIEKMDKLKQNKNYLKNYIPVPIKMGHNKHENSDALVPLVFNKTLQNIFLYGSGKTFLLQYFMRLWSKNTGFQKEIPYLFYIKLSFFKDDIFNQYRIDSTELMDLTQILLLLKGVQEGRLISAKTISKSSSWYELFSYELDKHPQRFCFFIDNSEISLNHKAYRTISQIVEKLMKKQPQCKVVMASSMPSIANFFTDKTSEIVKLLPWSPELLQRLSPQNINLAKWLDSYWLFKTTVHNLKVVKKQFQFISNNNQLKPDTMSFTQQSQMIEELQWKLQSKQGLHHLRKFVNDTWNEFYKKPQDEFNEKTLSKIRGYFPDEFNFLKLLALAMTEKNVSGLNRVECEKLWFSATDHKKLKKTNHLLKNKLQTEHLLQNLVRAGFLCITNDNFIASYQFSEPGLTYFYAVWWVEKFTDKDTKKEATNRVLIQINVELFKQYIIGMLSQKKEAAKLLKEFSIYLENGNVTKILAEDKENPQDLKNYNSIAQNLQTLYSKKVINLGKFRKSNKTADKEIRSTDQVILTNDKSFYLESDNKLKKDLNKKTKHGNNPNILSQSYNKAKEKKLDKNYGKEEELNLSFKI